MCSVKRLINLLSPSDVLKKITTISIEPGVDVEVGLFILSDPVFNVFRLRSLTKSEEVLLSSDRLYCNLTLSYSCWHDYCLLLIHKVSYELNLFCPSIHLKGLSLQFLVRPLSGPGFLEILASSKMHLVSVYGASLVFEIWRVGFASWNVVDFINRQPHSETNHTWTRASVRSIRMARSSLV